MKLDGEIIAAHSLWLIVTAFVLFDLPTSGIVTSLIGHRFAKPIMLTLVSFGGVTDSEFET